MKIIHTDRFSLDTLAGEWQTINAVTTKSLKYRVEITWVLDKYRIEVKNVARPDSIVLRRHRYLASAAITCANNLIARYSKIECPHCPLARQAGTTCNSDYHYQDGIYVPMSYPKGRP